MGPNSAGLGQRAPSIRAVPSPSSERIPVSRALDGSELNPPAHGSTSPSSSPSLRPSPLRTAKSLLRPVRSAGDGSPVPSETDSLAEHGFVRSTPSPAPATPVQQSPKSLTVRPPLPAKSRQRDSGIYEAAPPRIPDDARRARPSFGTTARSNSTSNATSFVESLSSRASSSILSPPHVEPRSSVYSDASSAEWGRCSMDSEGALHEGNAVTSAESPVEPTGAWSVPATAADHVPALRAAKEHSAGGLGIAGLVSVAQFDNDGDEVEEIRVRPRVDARSVSAPGLLSLRIEVPVRSLSTHSASSATTPGSERNGTSLYYSDADALGSEWPTDEGDSYKRSLLEFGESTWPDSSRETLGFVEQSAVIDRSGRNIEGVVVLPNTTHLLLQRTTSPLALPPFLALALPLAARLAILDISHCALVELPVALASCTKLRELDISGNHFCELPSFLATLLLLRVLIVNDCALESLPSLASLHKLRTLSLRANRMRSLPSWLCRLDKLDKLLVDDNPFSGQWQVVVQPILSPVTISAPELPPATVRPAPKSLNLRSSSYADLSHTLRTPPLVAKRSEGNLRASPTAGYDFASRRRSKSAAAPLTGSAISPSAATLSLSLASSTRSSVLDAASSPAPSTARSSPVSESRKWGKIFRKTSGGKPDSRRVSDPPVPPRTLSKKASSTSTFRRRVLSLAPSKSAPSSPADEVPPVPPMPSQEQLRSKRTSLLRVDPTSPISTWAFLEAPSPAAASFAAPSPPADPAAGLRSVIAYLRDVDDLSPAPTLDLALALAPPTPLSAKSRQSQYFSDGVSVVSPLSRPTSLQSTASFRPDRAKAMRVVQEIIETERSYVLALTELSEVYIAPASVVVAPGSIGKSGRKPEETMVPAIERRAVFGNIESITALHRTILTELLVAGASSEDVAGAVANVFIRHFRPSMKIYNTYVTSFDAALSRIVHWMDATPTAGRATGAAPSLLPALTVPQKKRIRSYLKECRAQPTHSQISLEAYLLLPVQRIPRYRLLLESLLLATPLESDDAPLEPNPLVKDAYELISYVVTDMNERKRESEGKKALLYWESRLGVWFRSPLVQSHRSLIKDGTCTLFRVVKRTSADADTLQVQALHTELSTQTLTLLLCTDMLVILKPLAGQPGAAGPLLDLFTVLRLNPPPGRPLPASVFGPENMLRLACDSRAILYLRCESRSAATAWMRAINAQQLKASAFSSPVTIPSL